MIEIPLTNFGVYKSKEAENIFDLDYFEPRVLTIDSEDAFIFDEETSSIAINPRYSYYNKKSSTEDRYKIVIPSEYSGHTVKKIGISMERCLEIEKEKGWSFWNFGSDFIRTI